MPSYAARLGREPDGGWVASAVALPNCWSRGRTREEALTKLAAEIRYRIELCPCSGVGEDFVRVAVVDGSGAGLRGPAGTAPEPWAPARPAVPAPLTGAAGCPPGPQPAAPALPGARTRRRRWDD